MFLSETVFVNWFSPSVGVVRPTCKTLSTSEARATIFLDITPSCENRQKKQRRKKLGLIFLLISQAMRQDYYDSRPSR